MNLFNILLIGIGLAMDCFAVSIAQGLQHGKWCCKAVLMAVLFGVFQGGMPLIGYGAGTVFAFFFKRFAPWIALLLLGWIGGKMIWEEIRGSKDRCADGVRTAGADGVRSMDGGADWSMRHVLALAVATSIDALATGVIFIPYARMVWIGVSIIALCSLVFGMTGFLIGVYARNWKINANLIGGIILVGIGIKIFIEGLCS
ncbi:MAG: manganese efflux pump MntP family protein [Paludibacteraceae bacterium]|nr:manganese efflux pump MntP family protein [Paludibacteraceae bacterium]